MSLLKLPYELRERILRHALEQPGTIELQHPAWGGNGVFAQPLFQTCRCLRDEALQAFYEVNVFLWVLDQSAGARRNPADYASMKPLAPWDGHYAAGIYETHMLLGNQPNSVAVPLTPARPWEYPHLRKHLRYLNLNIYLPTNIASTYSSSQAWIQGLPAALQQLVEALDHGSRLLELMILFTSRRFNGNIPLNGEQLKALEPLTHLRVKGKVKVTYPGGFKEVRESIERMGLPRVMKAT